MGTADIRLALYQCIGNRSFWTYPTFKAVAVRVTEGTETPPKLIYTGIVQLAEVEVEFDQTEAGKLTFTLTNSGFGYVSPPKVIIDKFWYRGNWASFEILPTDIDSLTGEIGAINLISGGSGYTSLPRVRA